MSIFNVQYTMRPFLTLQGIETTLPWEEGSLLMYRMKSSAMQLSATSLQYYSGDTLRRLHTWGVFRCTPTVEALCVSTDTNVTLMGTSPVVVPEDMRGPIEASPFLRTFGGSVCNSQNTGRLLGPSDVYTVSMCDLAERMLRFVLVDTQEGTLVYWRAESTTVLENVILALVALYASTNIANNTIFLISTSSSGRSLPSSGVYHVLLLTVLSFALFVLCQIHDDYYVSTHDYNLYVVLVIFLTLEICLMYMKFSQSNRKVHKMRDKFHFGYNVNMSTTMLFLVTLRLHNTFANLFFDVLCALFGIRTVCKLIQQLDDQFRSQHSWANAISVFVDSFVWSCLLAYGLAIADDVYSRLVLAANVIVSLLLGYFMCALIERRRTKAYSSE